MCCEPQDSNISDFLGLCIFSRFVTNIQRGLAAEATQNAHGTDDDEGYVSKVRVKTLKVEHEFNKGAGFNMGG